VLAEYLIIKFQVDHKQAHVRTEGTVICKDQPNTAAAYQTVEATDSFTIVTGQLAFEVT